MKNGLAYISFSDGRVSCLFRTGRNDAPLMFTAQAATVGDGLDNVLAQAKEAGIGIERAVVAMDGRNCFLRNYNIPIKGLRQVGQAAEFELDEDLPVPRSTQVCDQFRDVFKDSVSHVVAACAGREYVAGLIDIFAERSVVIERLDVDAAAFARACLGRSAGHELCVGLEIGRERTLCCVLESGRVQRLAVIPWGESALAGEFAGKVGLSPEEVDRIMLFAHGGKGAKSGRDTQAAFNRHLKSFIRKLVREAMRICGDGEAPTHYLLSGEIVRVQALRKEFEAISGGYLEVWDELSLTLGDEVDEGRRGSGLATAFGVAEEAGPAFNFRKDEFAYAGGGPGRMREVAFFGISILFVILAWGVYGYANLLAARGERDALRAATMEVYAGALPEVGRTMAVTQYRSILALRLEELGGTAGDHAGAEVTVIETLRAVSSALDKGIDVEFLRFDMDERTMHIQGETASLNDVESVRKGVVGTKIFSETAIRNAKADKKTKRINFEIEAKR